MEDTTNKTTKSNETKATKKGSRPRPKKYFDKKLIQNTMASINDDFAKFKNDRSDSQISLSDFITTYKGLLQDLKSQGNTYFDISDYLKSRFSITIKPNTLQKYLVDTTREKPKSNVYNEVSFVDMFNKEAKDNFDNVMNLVSEFCVSNNLNLVPSNEVSIGNDVKLSDSELVERVKKDLNYIFNNKLVPLSPSNKDSMYYNINNNDFKGYYKE